MLVTTGEMGSRIEIDLFFKGLFTDIFKTKTFCACVYVRVHVHVHTRINTNNEVYTSFKQDFNLLPKLQTFLPFHQDPAELLKIFWSPASYLTSSREGEKKGDGGTGEGESNGVNLSKVPNKPPTCLEGCR